MKPTPSSPPESNRLDILDRNALSIILLNAICRHIPSNDPRFDQIANARCDAPNQEIEVMALIAGVQVPLLPALRDVYNQIEAEIAEQASKKAEELVSAAALEPLMDALNEANGKIREALVKVGATFPEE